MIYIEKARRPLLYQEKILRHFVPQNDRGGGKRDGEKILRNDRGGESGTEKRFFGAELLKTALPSVILSGAKDLLLRTQGNGTKRFFVTSFLRMTGVGKDSSE